MTTKIVCLGGGPARSVFRAPREEERSLAATSPSSSATRAGETFGWGVVFSDETLSNLLDADADHMQAHHRELRALGRDRHALSTAP